MQLIREKPHRLDRNLYQGEILTAFTLCLQKRITFFTHHEHFQKMETILQQCLKQFSCEAHIYLFMPDHAHMLLAGTKASSDAYACIKSFKQKTGYWLAQSYSGAAWQKDFYDHVLRKDEDIVKQVKYILENPLRKNLVTDWKLYPFKGSTVYNFQEWREI